MHWGKLEKKPGAEHISTLSTVNNRAALYPDQGMLDEAAKMLVHALARKEKALDAEHTSTLQTINNLSALRARRRPQEARIYVPVHLGTIYLTCTAPIDHILLLS